MRVRVFRLVYVHALASQFCEGGLQAVLTLFPVAGRWMVRRALLPPEGQRVAATEPAGGRGLLRALPYGATHDWCAIDQ